MRHTCATPCSYASDRSSRCFIKDTRLTLKYITNADSSQQLALPPSKLAYENEFVCLQVGFDAQLRGLDLPGGYQGDGCTSLLERLRKGKAETDARIELASEGERRGIAYGIGHANYRIHMLQHLFRLFVGEAGVENHQTHPFGSRLNDRRNRILTYSQRPSRKILDDETFVWGSVAAEMHYHRVGLIERLEQVILPHRPAILKYYVKLGTHNLFTQMIFLLLQFFIEMFLSLDRYKF